MKDAKISRASLGRMPLYLKYIESIKDRGTISATEVSRHLGFGEVQVRKDLSSISNAGKLKLGFAVGTLKHDVERSLGKAELISAVVIGAGKLGKALIGYKGFEEYGIQIAAAFDSNENLQCGKIYPIWQFESFCRSNNIRIGIITVPADQAQEVCDLCVRFGITTIWNFAACELHTPEDVTVCREDLALSLAHLALSLRSVNSKTEE